MAASASSSDFSARFSARAFSPDQPAKLEPLPEQSISPASSSANHSDRSRQKPAPKELPIIFGISEHDFRSWATAVAILLGVVFVGWIFLHYWFAHGSGAAVRTGPTQHAAASTHAAEPMPAANSSGVRAAPSGGVQSRVEWRVVAFTYDRQDQAQKKASSLAQRYPTLLPAVFSPTGKGPWLVTVGGALQRDAAYALAREARSLGLPPDTYAQDYKAR